MHSSDEIVKLGKSGIIHFYFRNVRLICTIVQWSNKTNDPIRYKPKELSSDFIDYR